MNLRGLQPSTKDAMQLLMEGAQCFSRMSAVGVRIDTSYLDNSIKEVKTEIAENEKLIRESEPYKTWKKHYGNDMKLGSRLQLGHIIFDVLGYKRNPFMGQSNDIAAFEHLKSPFVKTYQDNERLKKALVTNLYGLRKEVVDSRLHAFFDMHTTESYRSSSSRINLHNQPIRNKKIAKIVRTCMIPSPGNELLESDYNTMEVRGSYCYNKDPKLRYDILNGDMHKDRAKDVYLLSDEELGPVNKDPGKIIRYTAKNRFVFANFYGDYYCHTAPNLWDAISLYELKTTKGQSLFEHLASKGIKKLGKCDPEEEPIKGTFEYHIREVERKMWEGTYTVYDQWKKDWWNLYQKQGGVNTLTGFCMNGVFRRNQILCDPIQGSSFHCLLWCIIQIQKQLMLRKMKAKLICQIHDSSLFDCPKSEMQNLRELCEEYMLDRVAKHWPWICIPLSVEFERAERNWFEKSPWK